MLFIINFHFYTSTFLSQWFLLELKIILSLFYIYISSIWLYYHLSTPPFCSPPWCFSYYFLIFASISLFLHARMYVLVSPNSQLYYTNTNYLLSKNKDKVLPQYKILLISFIFFFKSFLFSCYLYFICELLILNFK